MLEQPNSPFPVPAFDATDHSGLEKAFPRIDALFRDFMAKQHVPGLAYGIVIDGELALADGMGLRNVAEQAPVAFDSVFRIASMTKSFTAMAVVKLRDDGKLRLDNPAADYVPELAALPYPTRDSAPITVRQLLTMGAGFPQDDPWADRILAHSEDELTDLLQQGISFSNPPGIRYEYSNYGYGILGRIVTNVSGVPYQTYVTQQILEPLGMTSTTYEVSSVAPDRLAMGYRRDGNQWVVEPPLPDGAFASMGGLLTTIPDFARYMHFLLSAFPPRDEDDNGPVRRSSLREMMQPHTLRGLTSTRSTPDGLAVVQNDSYGYGLISTMDSVLGYSVSHGGGLPGYGTFYRILPDRNAGIVAFANLTYTAPRPCINEGLVILHQSESLRPRRLPASAPLLAVQDAITSLYERWDDEKMESIALDTFFMDEPLEKRREQVKKLRADFGKVRAVTPLEPENALRGRWTIRCANGYIEFFVTLSPLVPPHLQYWEITAAHYANDDLKKTAERVTRLLRRWDKDEAKDLFTGLKRSSIHRQFDALRVQYGKMSMDHVVESDGETFATLRLVGERSAVDMTLRLDPKSGKVSALTFARPQGTDFVP